MSRMSTTTEIILGSEAGFEFQKVSVKLNLGHISRGVPLEQVLACKHVGLQDVHVADLMERRRAVRATGRPPMCRRKPSEWETSCMHHDVRRLGLRRVDSNVVGLDYYLHCGRSVNENPAGVVGVGRRRVLKGSGWRKQLNVTICG